MRKYASFVISNRFLVIGFLLAIPLNWASFLDWKKRSHHSAGTRYDAIEVLNWIQSTENQYKSSNGHYTGSLTKLVSFSEGIHKEYSAPRQKIKDQPLIYPGLYTSNSFTGSKYFYSLSSKDPQKFQAEARYIGFVKYGDDVWEIFETGLATNTNPSKWTGPAPVWTEIARIFLVILLISLSAKGILFALKKSRRNRTQSPL